LQALLAQSFLKQTQGLGIRRLVALEFGDSPRLAQNHYQGGHQDHP
jgi:hypothetical protein